MNIIFDDELDSILRPVPKSTYKNLFRRAEEKRPISSALKQLEQLGVTKKQLAEIRECLNKAISQNIKKHFADMGPRIDYNDKYFLGQRVNRQPISGDFSQDVKSTFATNFGDAMGWKHTSYETASYGSEAPYPPST